MNAAVTVSLEQRLADLGGIPVHRVLTDPEPGTATLGDLVRLDDHRPTLEWIDSTLVEKAMGFEESILGTILASRLQTWTRSRGLGLVAGSDGKIRLFPGQARAPDVAFFSRDQLRRWERREPVPTLIPDLAIEVISRGNTRGEMARKRREYFSAGVREVWFVDPARRSIAVYTTPEDFDLYLKDDTVLAGGVLTGFSVRVSDLFDEMESELDGSAG